MEIKVLGTGCPGCVALLKTVEEAVAQLKLDAKVTKVNDMEEIMAYNIMSLPAIVIDEKVVSVGRKLNLQQVKDLLQ